MGRLFISALHKSSGKTMISVGLAAAFRARGLAVQTFKKGPDYIDPMWLAHASGRACYNLDFNTQEPQEIVASVTRNAQGADVALIEGNKVLHDGVDGSVSTDLAAPGAFLTADVMGSPVLVVRGETSNILAPDAAAALFEAAGAARQDRVIVYCGGGIAATLDAFLMFQLGYADVTIYDGSMGQWAKDAALPMEVG